eukprot:scaffold803_cov310-Pinguiococcus_pyrenoidosus.AAC.15
MTFCGDGEQYCRWSLPNEMQETTYVCLRLRDRRRPRGTHLLTSLSTQWTPQTPYPEKSFRGPKRSATIVRNSFEKDAEEVRADSLRGFCMKMLKDCVPTGRDNDVLRRRRTCEPRRLRRRGFAACTRLIKAVDGRPRPNSWTVWRTSYWGRVS